MSKRPIIFYSGGNNIDPLKVTLKKLGYSEEDIQEKLLSNQEVQQVQSEFLHFHINRPFIYIPVENKVNWKKVGIIGGAVVLGVGSIFAAPLVIGAAGFGLSGIVGGSAAASVQSVIYGGATGGVFSIVQSAGVVGFTLAGNAVIGGAGALAGAGLGAVLTPGQNEADFTIEASAIGLYRSEKKDEDQQEIKKFLKNKLKMEEEYSVCILNEKKITLRNLSGHDVFLPGVIIHFLVKKAAIENNEDSHKK